MASEDDPFWAAMNRTFPVAAASTTDYTGTPESIANEDDFLDGLFDEEEPQAAENPQYYGDLMPVTAANDALGRKRVAADDLTDYTKRVKTTTAQPGPGKPSSASNQRLLEMLRSGERSRSKSTPITKAKSQQKRTPQPQAPKAQLTQEELRSALQREVKEYVRMAEDDYDAKKQKLLERSYRGFYLQPKLKIGIQILQNRNIWPRFNATSQGTAPRLRKKSWLCRLRC